MVAVVAGEVIVAAYPPFAMRGVAEARNVPNMYPKFNESNVTFCVILMNMFAVNELSDADEENISLATLKNGTTVPDASFA
jgi:hypothetical protein